jgi:uncharacterized protein YbaA (DUF1428 family)
MYVTGYVVPVPQADKERYRLLAEIYWDHARANGAIEQMEAWEADVPDGKRTDFRRAVQIEPGEQVVFSWVLWPDKATATAFQAIDFELMSADPRMREIGDEMPLDGRRMIMGGFEPLVTKGRA